MEFLLAQGFETVRFEPVTAAGLGETVSRFSKDALKPGFDLPVDGLVLEYDDIEYAESLGATSKFPRDAMAFKWQDEEAETELLEIEWSASRTGLINPIAVFAPVELEGTTVSRASVHNVSIVEDLELGTGDRIMVYKANMIIPQISDNLTRSGTVRPPDNCPVCGAPTELRDTEGVRTLFCTNARCPAKKLKAFSHFVSRPCMNIEGLSEQTIEKFIAAGILHEPADIFRLSEHKDAIINMEGFGEKSFEKLSSAIERARKTTADRLLASLGVPEVGSATAKAIARALGNDWPRMAGADEEALSEIEGVGPIIASLYTAWFADPLNKAAADAVFAEVSIGAHGAAGVDRGTYNLSTPAGQDNGDGSHCLAGGEPKGDGAHNRDVPFCASTLHVDAQKGTSLLCAPSPLCAPPLSGKTFVVTGSLNGYKSRDLLAEKIEALGGRVSGSVSKKTDYLINNDNTSGSSKNKAAKALGVAIITEAEFEELAEADNGDGLICDNGDGLILSHWDNVTESDRPHCHKSDRPHCPPPGENPNE